MASIVVTFLVLFIIGIGPTLYLRTVERTATTSLALAPAMGLAIVTVISFPLYRYGYPVAAWAGPTLAILILISMLILSINTDSINIESSKSDLLSILILALSTIYYLSLELHFSTPYRSLYGANPSDALVYLTLTDTVMHAPWHEAVSGNLPSSTAESATLAEKSSTALFSARMIAQIPIRMATMIDMAWMRSISGLPGHEILFPFKCVVLLCIASATFAILRSAGVPIILSAMGWIFSIVNFWILMILEHDGYSQLHMIPLLLIFLYGWSNLILEGEIRLRLIALSAVTAVGISVSYTEYTVVFLSCLFLASLTAALLGRGYKRIAVSTLSVLAASAMLSFGTGQFGHHLSSLLKQVRFVQNATTPVGSTLLDRYLYTNFSHAPLGTWWLSDWQWIDLVAAVSLFILGLQIFSKRSPLIIVSAAAFLFGSMAVATYSLIIKQDNYSAFKVYSTAFPLVSMLAFYGMSTYRMIGLRQTAFILSASFILITQVCFVLLFYKSEVGGKVPVYITAQREGGHDLKGIVQTLSALKPRALIVDDPPDAQKWWHSAFLMLAIAEHKPFYRSGLLIDNNTKRLFHTFIAPPSMPDYVLISTGNDDISDKPFATLIRDFGTMKLYELSCEGRCDFSYRTQTGATP